MTQATVSRFVEIARRLGPIFRESAAEHDATGRFVTQNYALLKEQRLFSAAVPSELGGGGATHSEICQVIRELGQFCGSTALALSMHTHLVAAAVFRYRHGQPGEALLRKVAASELVLVSTGAGDWVDSVGRAERTEGGYLVSGVKRFCSGCLVGDLLITSAPLDGGERGSEVLHFPVPVKAPGVTIREDWDTLGMRATGSHSVELSNVFVPEEAIAARRPRGEWHPMWNVIVTMAAPIYTAAYVGVAERAAELARTSIQGRAPESILLQTLGELENHLTQMQLAWTDMLRIANDYDVEPSVDHANRMLIRKTLASNAAMATVSKAIELVGGGAFFRKLGLERMLRDVQGAPFHPLPEKKQLDFTGRVALGMSPVA
ncbi:MAG TPA: acyl-CoA dehydrogenase family protein [Polyangiaceae bacterium]|nr:acyl-CoA dehydrogenase family protein [Polyangiaceae bacterium]